MKITVRNSSIYIVTGFAFEVDGEYTPRAWTGFPNYCEVLNQIEEGNLDALSNAVVHRVDIDPLTGDAQFTAVLRVDEYKSRHNNKGDNK